MAKSDDGFFAQDEDYGIRMDEQYAEGEQFVVLSVEQDTPFTNPKTKEVIETRTKLLTRSLDPDTLRAVGLPVEVKTLAQNIYERAGKVTDKDFPAVCSWQRVHVEKYNNEATVLRKLFPYPVPAETLAYLNESQGTE